MQALKEELFKIKDKLEGKDISEEMAFNEAVRVCRLSGAICNNYRKKIWS